MTRGIIAKERASGDTSWASIDNVLQHDADIAPGNSGGPLIDENAQVVGINYRLNDSGQFFAISRDEALPLIEALRSGINVDSLGINSEAVTVGDELSGIWVASIDSGSPADEVGLKPGDIILSMEGVDLATDGTMATYCEILRSHSASDVMSLEVLRFDTEEVLEGQFNGRQLETSFSIADTVDEEADAQGNAQLPDAPAYETYVPITDEQGIITIEVPAEWADVSERPWSNSDDEQFGIQLWSAPDVEEFSNSWDVPGVVFSYSDELNQEFGPEDLIEAIDYSDSCTYVERGELPDGFFSGFYDVWENCGDAGSTVLLLGLTPETDDYMVRIESYSATQADLDASDHILDTFLIAPTTGRPDESESEMMMSGTVADIDVSGLLYDYATLDEPALSALVPATWDDIEGNDWVVDDETIGLAMSVAPDIENFVDTWTSPGFAVYMAQADGDPDFQFNPIDALESSDFSDTCEYDDRVEHEHTIYGITYTGAYDIWRNCDGEDNTFVVLSAASNPIDHGLTFYFLAVDEGDYEAFDVLEQSFYVNTEGVAPLIEEAASIEETTVDPDDFISFVDDEATFALMLPKAWDDVINEDWIVDDEVVGRSLTAAPDLDGFAANWTTPGVFVGTSTSVAQAFTPEELLDVFDYSDECTYDERNEYADGYLQGGYDIWLECAEVEGQAFIVFGADPVDEDGQTDDSQIVLLYTSLITESDVDAYIEMLASLVVSTGDAGEANSAGAGSPTATIVANALNVRSGPGTNYARVATVYRDDEVSVAGQSNSCAWLQVVTPDGQPGWVSGNSNYVTLNGDCDLIAVIEAQGSQSSGSQAGGSQSSGGNTPPSSTKGCYLFQNQLGPELTITFTRRDGDWNTTFTVPAHGEQEQCFDPGSYTYTLDAPPPWGSSNGELTVSAGDNYAFPISGE